MYGKLFTQMYDGTLATRGPWQALVTFQQFIVLADKQGVVDMTAEAISRRTTIPLEIIRLGIDALEAPDDQSRTPDLDGRRIVRLADGRDWGWQIVNYTHYRNMRSQEERREYMRKYQREYRAKHAGEKQDSMRIAHRNRRVNNSVNKVNEINQSSKQYAVSSKNQKPTAPAEAAPDLLVPTELWTKFRENRRALKAPLTDHADALLRSKLTRLVAAGGDPVRIVEQSIERGWKGLFAYECGQPMPGNGKWWTDDRSTMAKGMELGLHPRAGESMQEYRARISERMRA